MNWLDGPPTKPGAYWYQLQGSQAVRLCEVVWLAGELMCLGGAEAGVIPVGMPFRRWIPATRAKPKPDPSWLDPRYIQQQAER